MNRKRLLTLAAMVLAASMLTACEIDTVDTDFDDLLQEVDTANEDDTSNEDDTDTTEEMAPLDITGSYNDDWAATWEIGEELWSIQYDGATDVSYYTVSIYSNELEYAVAQNDPENAWNGGLWSRFDWTFAGDDLYMCQPVYDAETEAAAEAAEPADSADLDLGCDGNPWSLLTAAE